MANIENFNSFEDMLAFLNGSYEGAEAKLQEWQEKIEPGNYIVVTGFHEEGDGVAYGKISPNDPDNPLRKNSWLVKFYFAEEPKGYFAVMHASQFLGLLTEKQFQTARKKGWPANTESFLEVVADDPRYRVQK